MFVCLGKEANGQPSLGTTAYLLSTEGIFTNQAHNINNCTFAGFRGMNLSEAQGSRLPCLTLRTLPTSGERGNKSLGCRTLEIFKKVIGNSETGGGGLIPNSLLPTAVGSGAHKTQSAGHGEVSGLLSHWPWHIQKEERMA